MIIEIVDNEHRFRDAFREMGRDNQFSVDGLDILFTYLDELSNDIERPIEMDVIGFCCDYAEGKPEDIARDYLIDLEDDGNQLNNVLDYLHDHSIVCGVTDEGTIVYRQF
jgi:hypothetical protein